MNREQVVLSRIRRRWESRPRETSRAQLRTIRSQIDPRSPTMYSHLMRNPKKERITEERFTEIERENRILLEKMTKMHKRTNKYMNNSKKRSLNASVRQRRQDQIQIENEKLLKRIQQRKSNYSTHQMLSDRKKQVKRLHYLCQYPYKQNHSRLRSHDRSFRLEPLQSEPAEVYRSSKTLNGLSREIVVLTDKRRLIIRIYVPSEIEFSELKMNYTEAYELMNSSNDYQSLVDLLAEENGDFILNTELQ